jgi:hypothetical protein
MFSEQKNWIHSQIVSEMGAEHYRKFNYIHRLGSLRAMEMINHSQLYKSIRIDILNLSYVYRQVRLQSSTFEYELHP